MIDSGYLLSECSHGPPSTALFFLPPFKPNEPNPYVPIRVLIHETLCLPFYSRVVILHTLIRVHRIVVGYYSSKHILENQTQDPHKVQAEVST